jgi:hypothetical protein
MPLKKKHLPKPARRRTASRIKKAEPAKRPESLLDRLNDLTEQIEIMLPEMTARIAALEHLLIEKQLCTRQDLIQARDFVRIQED